MRNLSLTVTAIAILTMSGCAAMVAPDKKPIEITSDPVGINCHIINENGKTMSKERETPFYVTVHDDEYGQSVVCENGMRSELTDSVHGATFLNMWTLVFPVFMLIDYGTGNMFEYEDTHVTEIL